MSNYDLVKEKKKKTGHRVTTARRQNSDLLVLFEV